MPHSFQAVPRELHSTDMDKKYCDELLFGLSSLTVFNDLRDDGVIEGLSAFLSAVICDYHSLTVSELYCKFVSLIYERSKGNLTDYIDELVSNHENIYVKMIGNGKTPPEVIENSLKRELRILSKVASLSSSELISLASLESELPKFDSRNIDLSVGYFKRVENIEKFGYGKYAKYLMFTLDGECEVVPVKNADNLRFSELVDYEDERNRVIENTRALLLGKPAANILLSGDAGTGKSSTVKAVCNEFAKEGLRLIEIRKEQLSKIPFLLDELAENPLKFIIFIDDLSFTSVDDNFNALKAVLEGSVSARRSNAVIYATSNRRHLVKESFSDREGDDIHRNDTMQELLSLSARFGIHITFQKPDKKIYLDIVFTLAERNGINMSRNELELIAERYALQRGGRSARLAKQLIEELLSKEN